MTARARNTKEGLYSVVRRRVFRDIARRRSDGGHPLTADQRALMECIALLPDLLHLCMRLLLDRQVPARLKGPLIAAAAYVASPVDLIPEFVPVLGCLDDLFIVIIALNRLLDRDSPEVAEAIRRHWTGSDEILDTLRHLLATLESAISFIPERFLPAFRGLLRRAAR
ncbi:DUF1232 domain-containing protein [Candidatus Fermentibacterales bacterium]|nr:DUF1232 domain-containing protein [Candidatus Fermentibacterales bacterium]